MTRSSLATSNAVVTRVPTARRGSPAPPGALTRRALRGLSLFIGDRLKSVQIVDRALRVSGRLEDRAPVIGKDLQPGLKVGGVIRPRLEFRDDPQIRAKEATAKLGDQLFASAF